MKDHKLRKHSAITSRHGYALRSKGSQPNSQMEDQNAVDPELLINGTDDSSSSEWIDVSSDDEEDAVPYQPLLKYEDIEPEIQEDMFDQFLFP